MVHIENLEHFYCSCNGFSLNQKVSIKAVRALNMGYLHVLQLLALEECLKT